MSSPIQPVRQEIVIAAPPARVFDAWTDPEEIPRWYVERQEGDPRRDERIVWFITPEDLEGDGEPFAVRVAERERRLVLALASDQARGWRARRRCRSSAVGYRSSIFRRMASASAACSAR